jgi:hypothetical protein
MAIFISYLLMPLLALILIIIVWLLSKKNKLLKNKKFIFYVLLSGLILAIPSLLGFIDYLFMPYVYIGLQILYLLLGWLNIKYIHKHMKEVAQRPYVFEIMLLCTVTLLGMALFSIVFNLCNELQYGLIASTCLLPYLFISIYRQTYLAYVNIPLEIFKVWTYSANSMVDKGKLDMNNLMVIDIELFKNTNDTDLLRITAKASDDITFSGWFEIFLTDYNKKSPLSPIYYYDEAEPYSWIFYVKSSFLMRSKYIDPDLSFKENKIRPHSAVYARRVKDGVVKE